MATTLQEVKEAIEAGNRTVEAYRTQTDEIVREMQAKLNRLEKAGIPGAGRSAATTQPLDYIPGSGQMKSMQVGSDPDGGYLVNEEQSNLFFDRLRAESTLLSLPGLNVVEMTTMSLVIPRLKSSVTVRNPGERGLIQDSSLEVAAERLTARKYAVRTIASSEFLADSAQDARRLIADDHVKSIAQQIDLDAFEGSSGNSKIIGLKEYANIPATTLGSGSGGALSLDDLLDAITRLRKRGGTPRAIVMSARDYGALLKLKEPNQGRYLLTPDPTTDTPRRIFGVPLFVNAQLSETQDPAGTSGTVYVLDTSRLIFAWRTRFSVLVDPYSRSQYDQVVISTIARCDMGLIDPTAGELIAGVQPPSED